MFKDNLAMLRRANNLSQEEVAEKVNVSRQAYAKWERGESVPDIEKCADLAELYNTTLDDLYKEEKLPDGRDIMPAPKGKHLFGTVTVKLVFSIGILGSNVGVSVAFDTLSDFNALFGLPSPVGIGQGLAGISLYTGIINSRLNVFFISSVYPCATFPPSIFAASICVIY